MLACFLFVEYGTVMLCWGLNINHVFFTQWLVWSYISNTKLTEMKHLMTLMALVVAVTAGAQTGLVEFPYNPDSDGDDLIGTVDLLDLLALYGLEFSEEDLYLNDDSTTAIYYAGNMPYFPCLENCSTLPGKWKLPNVFEIGRVWSGVNKFKLARKPTRSINLFRIYRRFSPLLHRN